MLQKFRSKLYLVTPVLICLVLFTACASSNKVSETAGTGLVTETTMTDTVESSGAVSANQIATLLWNTSGTVSKIDVRENQSVRSGEILMSLDSTTAPASVIQASVDLVIAKQNLEDAKQSTTSIATAEVALAAAKVAYYNASNKYFSLGEPVGSEETIQILTSALLSAQKTVTDAETNYNRYSENSGDDPQKAAALAKLAQAKLDKNAAQLTLDFYQNKYSTVDAETIKANYNLAKAQLEDAQRTFDKIKDGNNSDAITSAQAKVDAAQATVNSLNIIAPFDGEIAVVFSQIGDVVSTNSNALILVNRSKLFVDVYIDETAISSVKVGNPAVVTFDALGGISTTGKVSLINPIGTSSSGVVNYTVRIELDKSEPEILIGATASVVIQTGDPKSVLFVPVSAVLNDTQGEYVMRINASGSQERVTIVSGQIVDDKVVVVGDLKAKDAVQLFTSSSTSTTTDRGPGSGMPEGAGDLLRP
jgi:RND family efflux transporter MFP subunit